METQMADIDSDVLSAMADQAQAEERVAAPEKIEQQDISSAEDVEAVGDDQDFDRTPWDDRPQPTEKSEPSKTETETEETETETNTNTKTSDAAEETAEPTGETATEATEEDNSWMQGLPPAPAAFDLEPPQFDEDGQVTNMTGEQFLDYVSKKATHDAQIASYSNTYMSRALDAAEVILPELKTDASVRDAFQNQLVVQTISGEGTPVDAARKVKSLLSRERAAGKQSAKTHIEVQKRSAIETPTKTPKKTDDPAAKIAKRIKAGDKDAQVDLMALWISEGKV